MYSYLNTSCKSSTNNMEVSWSCICFFLTFAWANSSDLIGKMRKLHLPYMSRRTVIFSFGYGYCSSSDSTTPTPLSCRVLCCLRWQHRCWNWTAWLTVRQCVHRAVLSFYQGFQARKSSWLNQAETKQIACPGLDFHRAALQVASVREFRLHHQAPIQILVQHLPLLHAHICSITVWCCFCYFPLLLILGPHCFYLCKYPVPHVDLGKSKDTSTETTDILENL